MYEIAHNRRLWNQPGREVYLPSSRRYSGWKAIRRPDGVACLTFPPQCDNTLCPERQAMSRLTLFLALTLLLLGLTTAAIAADETPAKQEKKVAPALKFKMKSLAGKPIDLARYQGKVVLFVNVASECGLTPQYRSLQALHESLGQKGLVVIGVPCNQFGGQEPGTATEISKFCQKNYGVTFQLLEKVDVNGEKACALYKHLTSLDTKPKGAGKVGWNFEKFLLGRDGNVAARFDPATEPDSKEILAAVKAELAKK
jgi:glutathione peroxidase